MLYIKRRLIKIVAMLLSVECERCLANRTAMKDSSITYKND